MISVFIATLTLDGPVKLAQMRGDGHPSGGLPTPNRNFSLCPKPTFDNNWLLNVLIRSAHRQSFESGAAKMYIRVLEKSLPPWGCILLAECKACSIWSVNSLFSVKESTEASSPTIFKLRVFLSIANVMWVSFLLLRDSDNLWIKLRVSISRPPASTFVHRGPLPLAELGVRLAWSLGYVGTKTFTYSDKN